MIRAAIVDLEPTIQRIPDVRLIHYVRDPRAVAVSQALVTALTFSVVDRRPTTEAQLLCQVMLDDLKAKRRLERRYPGAVLTVRYEDFVRDPKSVTRRVFDFVGQPVPAAFRRWTTTVMNVRYAKLAEDAFGTHRINSTATAEGWLSRASYRDLLDMNRNCRQVLNLLGYELLLNV